MAKNYPLSKTIDQFAGKLASRYVVSYTVIRCLSHGSLIRFETVVCYPSSPMYN